MALVLLTGGARSGKTRMAVDVACRQARPVVVVATAQAGDEEMAERIRRLVPQAEFMLLEGAGHSPMVDETERLVQIIAETASRAGERVAAGDPAA